MVEKYLQTVPDDDGDTDMIYTSFRENARDELNKFIGWVKNQIDG